MKRRDTLVAASQSENEFASRFLKIEKNCEFTVLTSFFGEKTRKIVGSRRVRLAQDPVTWICLRTYHPTAKTFFGERAPKLTVKILRCT